MKFFHAKITKINYLNQIWGSLRKNIPEEHEHLRTFQFSTSAKLFGNFGSFVGCRNTQKWRLGAYKSLHVNVQWFLENLEILILYYVYEVSVPSESTDSLIYSITVYMYMYTVRTRELHWRSLKSHIVQVCEVVITTCYVTNFDMVWCQGVNYLGIHCSSKP
jgi:uncharacterized membrane protein